MKTGASRAIALYGRDPSETGRARPVAKKSARKAATAGGAPKSAAKKPATKKSGLAAGGGTPGKAGGASPRLLSGGNPQIPKGYGDGPVQAYIDAMPDWKQAVGRLLDDLVVITVPGVRKAVKWNTPLYGFETDDGSHAWFLAYHCMTRYVKVTFFPRGTAHPAPARTIEDTGRALLPHPRGGRRRYGTARGLDPPGQPAAGGADVARPDRSRPGGRVSY